MTDKLNYTKRNPRILLTPNTENPETGPVIEIYKEDGSPNLWVEPTEEQTELFFKKFQDFLEDMDARDALYFMQLSYELIRSTVLEGTRISHFLAHTQPGEYDESLLCEGAKNYFSVAPEQTSTPNLEDMLKRFFPDKNKPN